MEQPTTIKVIKYCIVLMGVVFILWVSFAVYRALSFHVISTNPSIKKVTIISPFFNVGFNKSLSNKVTVSSIPNIISSYKVQGKELTTSLAIPLNPNQTYTIVIDNIYDVNGKHMADQKFVFMPKNVTSNNLPKDQSQTLLNNQAQYNKTVADNSLLRLLPFTEPNFEYKIGYIVNYSSQNTQIIFQITAPNQQSKQAALDWIKAQGFDSSKLNIQYITGQP